MSACSHHLATGVALLLLVEHGRVQRQPSPGPVLAGEHHHGRLHPGHRLRAGLQHMGRGHGEPVGVRVPGLQPAVLLLFTHTDTQRRSVSPPTCSWPPRRPWLRLNREREGAAVRAPPLHCFSPSLQLLLDGIKFDSKITSLTFLSEHLSKTNKHKYSAETENIKHTQRHSNDLNQKLPRYPSTCWGTTTITTSI